MSQFGTYPDYADHGVSQEKTKQLVDSYGPYPIPVQIGSQDRPYFYPNEAEPEGKAMTDKLSTGQFCNDECYGWEATAYCKLPYGHSGKHNDGEGVSWSNTEKVEVITPPKKEEIARRVAKLGSEAHWQTIKSEVLAIINEVLNQ